jgi:hypothetical protein
VTINAQLLVPRDAPGIRASRQSKFRKSGQGRKKVKQVKTGV